MLGSPGGFIFDGDSLSLSSSGRVPSVCNRDPAAVAPVEHLKAYLEVYLEACLKAQVKERTRAHAQGRYRLWPECDHIACENIWSDHFKW